MPRKEFSRKTRAQASLRAAGKCEACGAVLKPGEAEYDHILPDQLGGEPTLENCQILCRICHRGPGGKTATDVRRIRKTDRSRDKATGAIAPKQKIPGRGFPISQKAAARQPKQQLPYRALFKPAEETRS